MVSAAECGCQGRVYSDERDSKDLDEHDQRASAPDSIAGTELSSESDDEDQPHHPAIANWNWDDGFEIPFHRGTITIPRYKM